MGDDRLRVYFDPMQIGANGYPHLWSSPSFLLDYGTEPPFVSRIGDDREGSFSGLVSSTPLLPIKDEIRARDGHRCLRCKHPYAKGAGEWSECDEQCTHAGPYRWWDMFEGRWYKGALDPVRGGGGQTQAQWRILTVHHLNGVKADCRWWNLVSLCQRCHLEIQAKVHMERRYTREHSEWFKPFVAGYYAWAFLGEELTEDETRGRLDELLALEDRQLSIEGA